MLDIVKQIIDFYLTHSKEPSLADLKVEDQSLLWRQTSLFVTLFYKWNVRGSAWNIKELEPNVIWELIKASVSALNDSRFKTPLTLSEKDDIKIRIDEIKDRTILEDKAMLKLDPIKNWLIVIKKDYTKLAVILPNISPLLLEWKDFSPVLTKKLWEKYLEENFINYAIETDILTNY